MTRRSAEAQAVAGQWDEIRQWQAQGRLPPGPITPAIMNDWHAQRTQQDNELELLGYVAQLQPQHAQYLGQLAANQGNEAVLNALAGAGLSRGALGVVRATLEESGFAGTVERVQGRLAEVSDQNRTAFIEQEMAKLEAQQGDSPEAAKLKEQSPFVALERDPEVQKAAAALLAEQGIALKPGETPLRTLHGVAGAMEFGSFANSYRRPRTDQKLTEAEQRGALDKLTGDKNVGALFDAMEELDAHESLIKRTAARAKPKIEMTPEAAKRVKAEEGRRRTIENAYDRLDGKQAAQPKPTVRDTVQRQEKKPAPIARHEALERAADDLGITDDDAPQSAPDSSLHGVLSREYDRLESEPEEANV